MIGGVQVAQNFHRNDVLLYRLDAINFEHHIAIEKEIEKIDGVLSPNVMFDESSNFLLYLALLGSKAKYLCLFFSSNQCGF
jgi:hypothetical protein